jgi:hypothetical protein
MKRLNLLPKEKQRTLALENLFRGIVRFIELAALTFVVVFVAQLLTWSFLRAYAANLDGKIEAIKKVSDKGENAKLKAQIREINGQINDFKTLLDTTPAWSKAVKRVIFHIPPDVRVTGFNAERTTRKLEIRGFSPTREKVIEFYNAVKADTDHFKDIDYPLDNVTKPTNVNFRFTIELQETLLKK